MSISALSSSNAVSLLTQGQGTRAAPDGDSPAVEAAESAATKRAESQNGGVASKSAQSIQGSGLVNKLV